MGRLRRCRIGWRVGLAVAAAAIATGCSGDPPTSFVGESAHFRLYVDPDLLPLPYGFSDDDALAALETEWADVGTMLKMPDGKITYRWYTSAHAADACGPGEGGCTKEAELEVDAPTLPNEHELNHAYAYLRAQRRPIPLLAEGLAEAIACDGQVQVAGAADWRSMVASLSSAEVESQGGLFVRTLIRTYGIDAFLRYYEQSPERRDPALFGANFAQFWGASVDDVWAQAHDPATAGADSKICPCSLPALVPGAPVVTDRARVPYWTVPADLGGQTLALTAAPRGQIGIADCSGAQGPLSGSSVLAQIDGSAGWFVRGPLAATSLDGFVSDDCASAVPYPLAADSVGRQSFLTVVVPVSKRRSTVFVAVDIDAAGRVYEGPQEVCATCAFDQGTCAPAEAGAMTPVSGSFRARFDASSLANFPKGDLAWSEMWLVW